MQLRRISDHIARHNWTAAAVDLLIVVLGVFLGMQVTNWNADRLERQQGRVYFSRIADDVQADISAWEAARAYYGQAQGHGEAALIALNAPRARLGAQFLIDIYQATQIAPRPVTRGAYDEAVAGGTFRLVGDTDMRDRITNYYVTASGLESIFSNQPPYRERVRRYMPYDVAAAIASACSDVFSANARGTTEIAMPQTCAPALSRAQVARAVAAIRSAPDLRLDLNRQINDLDQKTRSFGLMIAMGQQLRADMDAPPRS